MSMGEAPHYRRQNQNFHPETAIDAKNRQPQKYWAGCACPAPRILDFIPGRRRGATLAKAPAVKTLSRAHIKHAFNAKINAGQKNPLGFPFRITERKILTVNAISRKNIVAQFPVFFACALPDLELRCCAPGNRPGHCRNLHQGDAGAFRIFSHEGNSSLPEKKALSACGAFKKIRHASQTRRSTSNAAHPMKKTGVIFFASSVPFALAGVGALYARPTTFKTMSS